jgi:hypothetical protein
VSKIIRNSGENGNGTASAAICGACGVNLTREQGWPAASAVFHCQGQSKAGQAHHDRKSTFGNCWKCKGPLGCTRCAGSSIEEALCRRCGVWGTKAALVYQGLLGGQRIEDYPAEWHDEYFAARAFRDGDSA